MALTGKDVGACLRDARERKGMSLRQIAASTRISVSALDAIERNDIRRLPGGIFSRAFVRGYAEEVGLDPEETVRDFVEQFPVEAVTFGSPLVETPAVSVDRTLDPDFKPWPHLLVIGAALAVGVVGLTLAVLWARGALTASAASDSPAPTGPVTPMAPSQTSSSAVSGPTATTVPVSGPARETSVRDTNAPVDGLRVTVSPDSRCWVRIVADGVVRFEGLIEKGASETREARRSLVLTVGDAAACQVSINGRRTRALGAAGRVATLRVTPDTLDSVLAP